MAEVSEITIRVGETKNLEVIPRKADGSVTSMVPAISMVEKPAGRPRRRSMPTWV